MSLPSTSAPGTAPGLTHPLLPKLRPLEKQLPVALFIAKESGKPLAKVVELRKSERFWLDVMNKTGVKPAVLFEGVQGKFPEPYKAAWIEYRTRLDEEPRRMTLYNHSAGVAHGVAPWSGLGALALPTPRLRLPRLEFDRVLPMRR